MKTDPIVEAVRQKLLDRSQIGIGKYGTTLEDSKESRLAFFRHAQSEMLDGANYLEVLIQREEKKEIDDDITWNKDWFSKANGCGIFSEDAPHLEGHDLVCIVCGAVSGSHYRGCAVIQG